MAKISIWKRFGGWLRGNSQPEGVNQVDNLDAENLLIHSDYESGEPAPETQMEPEPVQNTPTLHRSSKKEQQLAVMEDAFNRLVEVLESMNDNVTEQRKQALELNKRMELIADAMQSLPESIAGQYESLRSISGELKNQSVNQQKLTDILKTLPEAGQDQCEKLDDVIHSLGNALESQTLQNQSLNRFETTMQGMAENSKAQTQSMANIGQMLQDNQSRLQNLVEKQNKRFVWIIAVTVFLVLALGGVGAAIWFIINNSKGASI